MPSIPGIVWSIFSAHSAAMTTRSSRFARRSVSYPTIRRPYAWLGSLELWNGNEQAAIAASRKALELEPGIVDAHRSIGLALLSLGRRGEADAAFRKAQKLAPAHAEIPRDLRMVALAPRLPAVLRGEDRPANPAERIDFANLAYRSRRFAAAARLYTEALEEDPALADDRKAHHARQAAVYAALAGCVEGRDDPPPTADERTALRRQSLKLLHADLDARARTLERDPKESKNVIAAMRALREDYAAGQCPRGRCAGEAARA